VGGEILRHCGAKIFLVFPHAQRIFRDAREHKSNNNN
jgi:hypothetical protein